MVVDVLYREVISRLSQIEYASPQIEARDIFSEVLGISISELVNIRNDELSDELIRRISEIVERRENGEPLQYIFGKAYFMDGEYYVNHNVLIPREDTRVAIECALEYAEDKNVSVLEIGTGSGIISINLCKKLQVEKMVAVDISADAIEVARKNAQLHGADLIEFVISDLYSNVNGKFDIIISNPPYIASDVVGTLQKEIVNHEPKLALDGGEDGLDLIREIVVKAVEFLNIGGALIIEIGYDQGDALCNIMMQAGFSKVEIRKDFAGFDRVAMAILEQKMEG